MLEPPSRVIPPWRGAVRAVGEIATITIIIIIRRRSVGDYWDSGPCLDLPTIAAAATMTRMDWIWKRVVESVVGGTGRIIIEPHRNNNDGDCSAF